MRWCLYCSMALHARWLLSACPDLRPLVTWWWCTTISLVTENTPPAANSAGRVGATPGACIPHGAPASKPAGLDLAPCPACRRTKTRKALREASGAAAEGRRFVLHTPPVPDRWGRHHSKMMLIEVSGGGGSGRVSVSFLELRRWHNGLPGRAQGSFTAACPGDGEP